MKHKKKQKHLEGRHFIKTARMSRGPCNIQEDTPQRQTSVEAPARNQAAGEIDFSKPFICVFSPPKHPCLDKDGPCNTQDKAPLPKSPLEVPACGQAEGKKSAFCEPINVIFSPSKGRMEIHMFRKTRRDEDGRRITHFNVPQPESPVEAPACGLAAGEKSFFSEHPMGVSTPSKRSRLDEDVFHQPHQNVSCTGASEMPACQPVRKRKNTERHIQAKLNSGDSLQHRRKAVALTQRHKAWKASSSEILPCISSKDRQNDAGRRISHFNVPQPESPVEAPACGLAAGEKSSFSEHPIGVSTPSNDDVFHQPHQNISCTGASKMPAFQPVRKQKSTERHIQAMLNSEDALQRRHKAEASIQCQKAWKAPSSESFPSISSKDKQNDAGPCNTQDKAPLPKSPLEAPACAQTEGKKSAFCEPINVIFSPSKGRMKIHMFRKTRRDEDVFHQPHQNVSCTGASEMPAFQSVRKQKSTERHIQGRRITHFNVPQPESPVEAPACGLAAGEKSFFSEHPMGVSTPSKRSRLDEDEIKEMPVSQDSEQMESSSDYSHTSIPSDAPNNKEPFMSPVHGTDVRPMKIYYMHVQLKRGVAVLYHTKEGWEPPSKKIKMEEMTYIGKVHKNVPVYPMSEKKHLIAHEPTLDSGAQEKREEADSPAQPPALGGYPRAKTPEWLVALDSGFRCMACCRVFPSLEILQDHVEYGVREGFSCHVFHNAMAHLKFKARKRGKKEKEEKALFRR